MLDLDRIRLQTRVAAVEYRASVVSTNDLATEMARSDSPALPLLVVADTQTAGRGRGSNRWWTGNGSLAFSLVLAPESFGQATPRRSAMAALAAGVAVAETLAPLLPAHRTGIHWPNDVMAAGRKLSGILVEVLSDGRHIIGIGINTNNTAADAPPEVQSRVGTLRDLSGQVHDQTAILVATLQHLDRRLTELATLPEAIARQADALCLQRGSMLTVVQGDTSVAGRCAGIAADGALVLETTDGRRAIYSGVIRAE